MAWNIEYSEAAKKTLKKLDRQIARKIMDHMDEKIAGLDNPRTLGKALKGPLGEFWRYRIGDYRVVCDIRDKVCQILVVKLGNRKDVYS